MAPADVTEPSGARERVAERSPLVCFVEQQMRGQRVSPEPAQRNTETDLASNLEGESGRGDWASRVMEENGKSERAKLSPEFAVHEHRFDLGEPASATEHEPG